MDQSGTQEWPKKKQGMRRLEEELVMDAVCQQFYLNYMSTLPKKLTEGFGDFKRGHVICTVKYADDLVLLAKEETILQGMNDGLGQDGRCHEIEMNVDNTKVLRISREPSPVQITIDKKQLGNVEYFYLGSLTTSDARCTHEIN